jgi:Lipocalin-like domain
VNVEGHASLRLADLIGTWSLTGWDRYAGGVLLENPLGLQPVGLLTYDAAGFVQVQIVSRGRELKLYRNPRDAVNAGLRSHPIEAGAAQEVAGAYTSFAGYAGRYEVDLSARIIRHHIITGIDPNMVGGVQERQIEFRPGGILELRVRPYAVNGRELFDVLSWKRAVL